VPKRAEELPLQRGIAAHVTVAVSRRAPLAVVVVDV